MVESVGRRLQQARLARKLEIEDVADRTKIRPERIIDLEADEYSQFPNLTYAKSFLAKYARFLGLDIQAELDGFEISSEISMGDYQYLSSFPAHGQQPRWATRIQPKGFRVPPVLVALLVLIVLVGVPLFSYLALNIPRVAGTSFASPTNKADQPGDAESTNKVGTPPSISDSLKSWAVQTPSAESGVTVAPSPFQQPGVGTDSSRIEAGIEVRRALPPG